MIKLNLGSHNKDAGKDYINIDVLDLPNVDALCNLEVVPFELVIKDQTKFTEEWDLFEDQLFGRTPFILKANFVDEIKMDEVLEHLCFEKIRFTLKEIYRILKVEGKFKFQVPDIGACMTAWYEKKICECVPHKAMLDGSFPAKKNCLNCKGEAIVNPKRWLLSFTGAQKHPYDFHKAIFTKKMLDFELRRVGFADYRIIEHPIKIKVEAIK